MKKATIWLSLHPIASAVTIAAGGAPVADALAQGVATERELAPIIVIGTRSPLDPNLPTTTSSVTAGDLKLQNFVNTEDALKYAPNLNIRKRYIGDRNALIGGRSSSNLQAQRGLVYVDGLLISNFLGRFNAPRWNIVSPEEVQRVDILYGPFSAIYPGNSIGTTVAITTKFPEKTEASIRALAYSQEFSAYGLDETYTGDQESAYFATRRGDWSFTVGMNRLKSESHPMQYQTFRVAEGSFEAGGTAVTGAITDTDPTGAPRVVAGANSGALEHAEQQQVKLKLGYEVTASLQAQVLYAHWRNDYRRRNHTFLRDASGNEVWSGQVRIDGLRYTIPNNAFAPSAGDEEHAQTAFSIRSRHKTGWNHSAVLSQYMVLKDQLSTADLPDPLARDGASGALSVGDGTGWRTLELQSTYTPAAGEQHALTFGFHANRYQLENYTYEMVDWRDASTKHGDAQQHYKGKTAVQALYAQDAWRFHPDWTVTFGVRYERWKGYGGEQFISGANGGRVLDYHSRSESAVSPKASLAWVATDEWLLRASVGKGVRFPTVSELYQGSRRGTDITVNDPDLQPEVSYAKDLTAIRETEGSTFRVSVFEDDIRNTILQQTNINTNVTNVQNIERVRTRGIEFAYTVSDVLIKGLNVDANLAFARSKTLKNSGNPAYEGKYWLRVPKVRGNVVATYKANARWAGMLAVRHSGRQYANADNSDVHPDTYGGVSRYTVWDTRITYTPNNHTEFALGIENLADKRYFVFHPYPGRTVLLEARLSY